MNNLSRLPLYFAVVLSALAAAASVASAQSLPAVQVSEIQLAHVTKNPNRSITAYYASGHPARLAMDGGIPVIRTLEGSPVNVDVASDGSATIPATAVPRVGFQIVNYLVIIVHSSSSGTPLIKNADGTMPTPNGLASSAGTDASSFDNDRVIYLQVKLDASRRNAIQIGSKSVQAGSPVTMDLGG